MAERPKLRIERVPRYLKLDLHDLLAAYLEELATLAESAGEVVSRDNLGTVSYPWFDAYWSDAERVPLGIWVSEDLQGFCFLRDTGSSWEIAEFYVRPEQRRGYIGRDAMTAIKELCRSFGTHQQLTAVVRRWNPHALTFWRRQGFEIVDSDGHGTTTAFEL